MKKKVFLALIMSLCLATSVTTFTGCSFGGDDTKITKEDKDDDDDDDTKKDKDKDKDKKKDKDKEDKDKDKNKDKDKKDKEDKDEVSYDSSKAVIKAFWKGMDEVDKDIISTCFHADSNSKEAINDNYDISKNIQDNTTIHLKEISIEIDDDTDAEDIADDYGYEKYDDVEALIVTVPLTQEFDGITYEVDDVYSVVTVCYDDAWYIIEIHEIDTIITSQSGGSSTITPDNDIEYYDFNMPELWNGKDMGGLIDSGVYEDVAYYQAGAAIGAVDGWGVEHNVSGCYYDSNYSNKEIPNVVGGSSIGDKEGDAFRQGYDDAFKSSKDYALWSCIFFGATNEEDIDDLFPGILDEIEDSENGSSTPTQSPVSDGSYSGAQVDLKQFGTPDYEYTSEYVNHWAWYDIKSKSLGYEIDVDYNVQAAILDDYEDYESTYYKSESLGTFKYNGKIVNVYAYIDKEDNCLSSYIYLIPSINSDSYVAYDVLELDVYDYSNPIKSYTLSSAQSVFDEFFN